MTLERPHPLRPDDRHALGDHRVCQPEACGWAERWRELALEAGRVALARNGRRFAVLCLRCDPDESTTGERLPHLLGTVPDRWSATGLRNSHAKRRHGNLYETLYSPVAFKGIVVVVETDWRGKYALV